jgi:hypothetical protein
MKRGQPFELGNKLGKGRPPGSRNKKSIFQDAMEGKGSIEIIDTAKLQALKKDPSALRLCVERLVPVCKAPNSRFPLPRLRTLADSSKAISAVVRGVAKGHLSAQEGESVARIIESYGRVEAEGLEQRIQALEQKYSEMENQHVRNN